MVFSDFYTVQLDSWVNKPISWLAPKLNLSDLLFKKDEIIRLMGMSE